MVTSTNRLALSLLLVAVSACDAKRDEAGDEADTFTARSKHHPSASAHTTKKAPSPPPTAKAVEVAFGERHGCALLQSGGVQCWGRNEVSQLGLPVPEFRLEPGGVVGVADAKKLVAAANFSCVIGAKGEVQCWGDVPERGKSSPLAVPGFEGAVSLAAGPKHLCAAIASGEVRCLGSNDEGQLGHGSVGGASTIPEAVTGLAGAVEVVAGDAHSCARTKGGEIQCWGANDEGQLGDGTKTNRTAAMRVPLAQAATVVATGDDNTCVVLADGTVNCWGETYHDMLGGRDDGTKPQPIALHNKAKTVSVGTGFACVVLVDDTVECWGNPDSGRVGRESSSSGVPSDPIAGLADVATLFTGPENACAVLKSGEAKCWGSAAFGRLGNGSTRNYPIPIAVPDVADAIDVAAGDSYSCALRKSGAVACWGDAGLDTGSMEKGYAPRANSAQDRVGLAGVTAIFGLDAFVLAKKSDGAAFGVRGGQLRDVGHYRKEEFVPKPVPKLDSVVATSVMSGDLTFGIDAKGSMLAFKMTTDGPLESVIVQGVTDAVALDAASDKVCIVTKSGTLGCFESTLRSYDPLPATFVAKVSSFPGVTDAKDVVVSHRAGCVLHATGDVSCWDAYASDPQALTKLPEVTGAKQLVQSGDSYDAVRCALLRAGTIRCWSEESHEGQLGSGTFLPRKTPAQVTGISDATKLAAGEAHVCAMHKSGNVTCWGGNEHDEVGGLYAPAAWAPTPLHLASPMP